MSEPLTPEDAGALATCQAQLASMTALRNQLAAELPALKGEVLRLSGENMRLRGENAALKGLNATLSAHVGQLGSDLYHCQERNGELPPDGD